MGRASVVEWLRWLAVVPAALLASMVVFPAILFLVRWSNQWAGVEPDSFLGALLPDFFAAVWSGIVLVFAAAYVAPKHERMVAVLVTLISTLATGYLLFPAIQMQSWRNIVGMTLTLGGSIGAAVSVWSGKVSFMRKRYGKDDGLAS